MRSSVRRRSMALAGTAFVLPLLTLGCSKKDEPPAASSQSSTSLAPVNKGVEIGIKDRKFDPADATAQVNKIVTWKNNDSVKHTLTEETSEATPKIRSDLLAEGQTFDLTFDKPGTYRYTCSIHSSMKGTITVTA